MSTSDQLRKAALAGDLDEMSRLLDGDPSLTSRENPEGLPLARLAQTVQLHMAILDGAAERVRELVREAPDLVSQRWTLQRFDHGAQRAGMPS